MAGIPTGPLAAEFYRRQLAKANTRMPMPELEPLPQVNTPSNSFAGGTPLTELFPEKTAGDKVKDFLGTPIVKSIIDAISVGNYATANIANNFVDTAEQGGQPSDYVGDIVEGIVQGVKGAGGNEEYSKGFGPVVERVQKDIGIDTDSESAKRFQMVGGLAGDILLDPLTYVTLGAGKGVIEGVRNANKYAKSSKELKAGMQTAGNTEALTNGSSELVGTYGKYSDEYSNFLNSQDAIRLRQAELPSSESLKFDAIRPSARIQKDENLRRAFSGESSSIYAIRNKAKSRREAFTAGYKEGSRKFHLDQRQHKLMKVDGKRARKYMPVTEKLDKLSEEISTMSAAKVLNYAEDIVRETARVEGRTVSPNEIKAEAKELADQVMAEHKAAKEQELIDSLVNRPSPEPMAPITVLNKSDQPKQEPLFNDPVKRMPITNQRNIQRTKYERETGLPSGDKVPLSRIPSSVRGSQGSFDIDSLLNDVNAKPVENTEDVISSIIKPVDDTGDEISSALADADEILGDAGKAAPEAVGEARQARASTVDAVANVPVLRKAKLAQLVDNIRTEEAAILLAKVRVPSTAWKSEGEQIATKFPYTLATQNQVEEILKSSAKGKITDYSKLVDLLPAGKLKTEIRTYLSAGESIPPQEIDKLKKVLGALSQGNKQFEAKLRNALKTSRSGGVSDESLLDAGILPEDIQWVKSGGKIRSWDDSDLVGDIESISKAIRSMPKTGSHPLSDLVDKLEDVFDVEGPEQVAAALTKAAKDPRFKFATKFGDVSPVDEMNRIGTIPPYQAYLKSDSENIKLINPVDRDTAEQVIKGEKTATFSELASLPVGNEVISKVEQVIADAADYQSKVVGPNRSLRVNASTKGPGTEAKINEDWNTSAAMRPYNSVLNYVKYDLAKVLGREKGKFSAAEKDKYALAAFKYMDARLMEEGIDFQLTNMAPTLKLSSADKASFPHETTVRIGMSDIYEAMGPGVRRRYVFGGTNPHAMMLSTSQLLDFGEMMVRSATRLGIDGNVDKMWVRNNLLLTLQGEFGNARRFAKGNIGRPYDPSEMTHDATWYREIKSNLDGKTRISNLQTAAKRLGLESDEVSAIGKAKSSKDAYDLLSSIVGNGKEGAAKIAEALKGINRDYEDLIESFLTVGPDGQSALGKLLTANLRNTALVGARISDRVTKTSIDEFERIASSIKNGTPGEAIEQVSKRTKDFDGIPEDGDRLVNDTVDMELGKIVSKGDTDYANKVTKLDPSEKAATNAGKLHEKVDRSTDNLDELLDISVLNMSDNLARSVGGLSLKFSASFGKHVTFETSVAAQAAATRVLADWHAVMNTWKRGTKERKGMLTADLNSVIGNIQRAVKSGQADLLDGAEAEVYDTLKNLFDTSKYNFFQRNGIDARVQSGARARYEKNMRDAFRGNIEHLIPKEGMTSKDISNMWLDWEFKNSYDFLSNLIYVNTKTANEITAGAAITSEFGSKVKLPGYVKFVDKSGKNDFATLVDDTLYYPQEVVAEFGYLDRTMKASRVIVADFMKDFVPKVFDPVISFLKMTQTTMKPGHHVMSVIGDGWRNMIVTGSPMMTEYKQMGGLIKTYYKRNTTGNVHTELQRSIDNLSGVMATKSPKDGLSFIINGKNVKLSDNTLIDYMEHYGVVLPKHSGGVQEDLLTGDLINTPNSGRKFDKTEKVLTKLTDNKFIAPLNSVAAYRDSYMRGALFLHYMKSKRFKSIDEAAAYSAARVKEVAPIAADLAVWESKVARRVIFYYTWIRGMTPRILEYILAKPGLSSVGNKVMYEMAASQGLDPISFGDPFSEDMKGNLPDYYTERVMGPAWLAANGDAMGMSITHPTMDILNTWGANIAPQDGPLGATEKTVNNLIGMASPWIKAPIEIATRRNAQTGAPIESVPQYLQDMVGPARFASKVTGKSFDPYSDESGSGLFQNRTEARFRDGMDEEFAADNAAQEIINQIFGSQLTNYSTDQVKNAAQFQQMEKIASEKKQAQRRGE